MPIHFNRENKPATDDFSAIQVIGSLSKSSLTRVRDPALPVCWSGKEPFKSIGDVKGEFKPLQLAFIQGTSQAIMEIPPENYLIITVNIQEIN